VEELRLQGNWLTGPLFPDAWLLPGALPDLRLLDLSFNQELRALSLPSMLPWPKLTIL